MTTPSKYSIIMLLTLILTLALKENQNVTFIDAGKKPSTLLFGGPLLSWLSISKKLSNVYESRLKDKIDVLHSTLPVANSAFSRKANSVTTAWFYPLNFIGGIKILSRWLNFPINMFLILSYAQSYWADLMGYNNSKRIFCVTTELIPSEKIKEYVDNAYKIADKLRNIYVLEAEFSFNYQNAEKSENNPYFSNGQAMILKDISELSVDIDILKENSKYQIAINALTCPDCKPITLEIRNKEYSINLNNSREELKWIYLKPIELQRGTYKLKIKSTDRAVIDSIIIYSTNGNETLEDIFTTNQLLHTPKENPAKIT